MIQLILSLLALSTMGAVLALLLEIADSFLADYGEKHILINKEKDLVVKGGMSLLSSLMEEGVFLPSACGGKGTCAYCKVKVIEGGGPLLPTETPYLSEEELNENMRLSCQVKVKDDLEIQVPEELLLVKEFRVRVERVRALTPDIREVRLSIITPEEGIHFKPGQYVQLHVPKYELTKEDEYRAYSISSSAENSNQIELIITKMPGGVVSTYVHDYLKEGDELLMSGPYGDFYLRESDKDILFIATGSGLAPIKSILHQMKGEEIRQKATLFFGDRTRKDLYYIDELEALGQKMFDFTFIPTLSRSTDEDNWQGEKGRVTDLIEKHIPENADIDVYICGAPAMIQSCVDLLKKKGIPEDRIIFDKFE
jgi:Na+-transporting NADH:ubiquinone oxidoreductase subunit F